MSLARAHAPAAAPRLAGAIAALHARGALTPRDETPTALAARLIRVAEDDLSLARLVEGHANALALIAVHGTPEQITSARAEAARGRLFGVWGADGAEPVALLDGRLSGGKRFASGLGIVARALVTAGSGAAQRLVLVDATDPGRQRPETWDMAGMQDTLSGDFDCAGLPAPEAALIGPPGAYGQEPHFVGGVWRIAAVQLGGALGLLGQVRDMLAARGQLEAEAHMARLAPVLFRALAAGEMVRETAEAVAAPGVEPEAAVARAIAARLLTEEIGQAAIAAAEQSVGLAMFAADSPVGQTARDLACYMRQAARDAFLQRAARRLFAGDAPFSNWLAS
ncbi:Acyl-CoA dehydrogenase [Oceanicola granulosus HTCC2516]|uniref:Acyl-CoA dehydrogenase n=1 Tax=Oceanicola granulosus (strain ATCC BAA-861 / DSM 15982 / KCTC 12143 / HTCC2516) TaxID=314256 RepID=Q2CC89_OCEGH|nr:acyl-CoA/acyl-ACP dehydrogenase [Oceanicola granulosus]EAR50271.1 Acyl-CoA dehydrogenase [Oceanicola granulosus HTCC2516]